MKLPVVLNVTEKKQEHLNDLYKDNLLLITIIIFVFNDIIFINNYLLYYIKFIYIYKLSKTFHRLVELLNFFLWKYLIYLNLHNYSLIYNLLLISY